MQHPAELRERGGGQWLGGEIQRIDHGQRKVPAPGKFGGDLALVNVHQFALPAPALARRTRQPPELRQDVRGVLHQDQLAQTQHHAGQPGGLPVNLLAQAASSRRNCAAHKLTAALASSITLPIVMKPWIWRSKQICVTRFPAWVKASEYIRPSSRSGS